jgi:hypothetical protein
MKNNTKSKPIRYFGEIQQLSNGQYRIKFMKRLVGVNQHRRKWREIDTLDFAKKLNSKLIVN